MKIHAQAAWNQGSGCISRNLLLTNYTFPSFIFHDNNIFVSCTTVKTWLTLSEWINHTKQRSCTWKMLIILLLNKHSDVVGWQLTSRILEKSVLATPHVRTFCLNGTTHLLGGTLRCDRRLSRLELWAGIFKKINPPGATVECTVQGCVARSQIWSGDVNNGGGCTAYKKKKKFKAICASACAALH